LRGPEERHGIKMTSPVVCEHNTCITSQIYDLIEQHLIKFKYGEVDEFISNIDVSKINEEEFVAILISTFYCAEHLPSRVKFINSFSDSTKMDPVMLDKILDGLI